MERDSYFKDFTFNTLTDNVSYQIVITPNYVHTIGVANTYSTTTGILIANDTDFDNAGTYTWLNQGTPYIIEAEMRIGTVGEGVTLNISPGCVIKFMETARLVIPYAPNEVANINAVGTSTQKIIFTAYNANPGKKDWKGLAINQGAKCNFEYCEFTHAGYTGATSGVFYLNFAGTNVSIKNSLIAHSISNGISVSSTSSVDITNGVVFDDIDLQNYYVR